MIRVYPSWPFQNQSAKHDLHCRSRYFLVLNHGKLYYFYAALSELVQFLRNKILPIPPEEELSTRSTDLIGQTQDRNLKLKIAFLWFKKHT